MIIRLPVRRSAGLTKRASSKPVWCTGRGAVGSLGLPLNLTARPHEMDQNDLESLLATLRQAQDSDPGVPGQRAPPPQLHQSPGGPPSQYELNSLLTTLSALPDAGSHSHSHSPAPPTPAHPLNSRTKDLSQLTFQEAVPRVNALAMDPHFLEQVEQLWDEQKTFELRQKDERNRYERELRQSGARCALSNGCSGPLVCVAS